MPTAPDAATAAETPAAVDDATREGEARSYAALAVDAAPPALALTWRDEQAYLEPLSEVDYAASVASEPERFIVIADAGVWEGREDHPRFSRSFLVLCGRTVAICDFANAAPLEDPAHYAAPDAAEWGAIHAVLRGLAGPQRLDVQVLRIVRCPAPLASGASDGTVYVFLPDMHLPLVPPMPDLPAELVPDPTRATCFCHGPVMARILGRSAGTVPMYSAVGTAITRDPNEWFYLMAEHYRPVADDLVKFLGRFQKLAQRGRAHLVQLGGLFEIWAGFDVTFAANGRAGQIVPKIIRGTHLRTFTEAWFDRVRDTASRRALVQLARLPPAVRTLLQDDPVYFARDVPLVRGAVEQPALDVPPLFHAEHHPRVRPIDRDAPPIGFLALMEQNARFLPWQRTLTDDFRTGFTAWWVESLLAQDATVLPGALVSAYTHVPFLAAVRW